MEPFDRAWWETFAYIVGGLFAVVIVGYMAVVIVGALLNSL